MAFERNQDGDVSGDRAAAAETRSRNQGLTAEFDAMSRGDQLRATRDMSATNGNSAEVFATVNDGTAASIMADASPSPAGDFQIMSGAEAQAAQIADNKPPVPVYTNADLGRSNAPSAPPTPADTYDPKDVVTQYHAPPSSSNPDAGWNYVDPATVAAQQAAENQARQERAQGLANEIEHDASGAVDGNAQAQLDLRVDVYDLRNQSPETRDQTLADLTHDGSYWKPGAPPAAEVQYDENGQPTDISFSRLWTIHNGGDTVPLNESPCDQALERYNNASQTEQVIVQKDLAHGETGNYWYEGVLDPQQMNSNGAAVCKPEFVTTSDMGNGNSTATADGNFVMDGDQYAGNFSPANSGFSPSSDEFSFSGDSQPAYYGGLQNDGGTQYADASFGMDGYGSYSGDTYSFDGDGATPTYSAYNYSGYQMGEWDCGSG